MRLQTFLIAVVFGTAAAVPADSVESQAPPATRTATVRYVNRGGADGWDLATVDVRYSFRTCPGGGIQLIYDVVPTSFQTNGMYHFDGVKREAPGDLPPTRANLVQFAGQVIIPLPGHSPVEFADLGAVNVGGGCLGQSRPVGNPTAFLGKPYSPAKLEWFLSNLRVETTDRGPWVDSRVESRFRAIAQAQQRAENARLAALGAAERAAAREAVRQENAAAEATATQVRQAETAAQSAARAQRDNAERATNARAAKEQAERQELERAQAVIAAMEAKQARDRQQTEAVVGVITGIMAANAAQNEERKAAEAVRLEAARASATQSAKSRETDCDRGNGTACSLAGAFYAYGEFAEPNQTRAARLFERACELRSADGCSQLGAQYFNGAGVKADSARAVALWQRACNEASAVGCMNLGVVYATGRGAAKDHNRALALYQRSCTMGRSAACVRSKVLQKRVSNARKLAAYTAAPEPYPRAENGLLPADEYVPNGWFKNVIGYSALVLGVAAASYTLVGMLTQ